MYRLSSISVSRGKGQSAVASLAYRTGKNLYDERLDKTFNYTNKDVSCNVVLLPKNANSKYNDVGTLANAIEKAEKRGDSELLKEYILTLPLELDKTRRIQMVKDFANENFVSNGLACNLAFHDLDGQQPHCHLTTTTRSFNELGDLGKKERFFKETGFLIGVRQDWARTINNEYALANIDKIISADTLRKQGLNLQPINSNYKNIEDRQLHIAKIKAKNRLLLLKEPQQIANFLTYHKAVFTDKELQDCIVKYVGKDNLEECYHTVFHHGNTLSDTERKEFTSADYKMIEAKFFDSVATLYKTDDSKNIASKILQEISKNMTLSVEQKSALYYATRTDSNIKNIQGFAGSGKSYTMKAISDSYTLSGYNCRGLALSGVISDSLGNECNIKSSTVASFLYGIEKERELITDKTVFFIDEASMIGTRDYQKILDLAVTHHCKIISVGDDNQLQSIQGGASFRGMCENTTSVTLSEIRRQRDDQDKLATLQLSTGKIKKALEYYNDKDCISFHNKKLDMVEAISNSYLSDAKNNPNDTSLIMAHANIDVACFNEYIHDKRKAFGELGNSTVFNDVEYSVNDRFVFLSNDNGLGVKNGTIGTIEVIKGNEFQIKIDSSEDKTSKRVNFNTKDYDKFSQAYALTIHKSQGVTVDKAHVYIDKNINSNLVLVGCSRHRKTLQIHCLQKNEANKKGFTGINDLVKSAERKQIKELVRDKLISLEHKLANKNNINELQRYSTQQKTGLSDKDLAVYERLEKITALEKRRCDLSKLAAKTGYGLSETKATISKQLQTAEMNKDKLLVEFQKNNHNVNKSIASSDMYKQVSDMNRQRNQTIDNMQQASIDRAERSRDDGFSY